MATTAAKRLINVKEYYKMAEVGILKPDDRVELIQGEIYEMSPIGSKHASIVNKLAHLLNKLFQQEVTIRIQSPIRINDNNEPEPDISISKYREDFYASAHPQPEDVLMVLEVADTSIRYDRQIKGQLYAECAIPEYWIIDISSQTIEIMKEPKEGRYLNSRKFLKGELIDLLDKSLSVNEIMT